MKLKKIVAAVLAGAMALSMAGCVDQHPEDNADSDTTTRIESLLQHLRQWQKFATSWS